MERRYDNLLAQVRGRKELLLFPPEDLARLQYRARPKGTLSYEWPNTFVREPIVDEATRVIFAASVNLTHPSAAERTALRACTPLRCTLRPGETLLLPAYWHHEVYSHPASAEEEEEEEEEEGARAEVSQNTARLNVAVNFWFRNTTAPPPEFA